MTGNIRSVIIIIALLAGVLTLAGIQCTNSAQVKADPRGAAYASEASCVKCHNAISRNYAHTSHYTTSAPLTEHALPKNIVAKVNTFLFNDTLKVNVTQQPDGMYQAAYNGNRKLRAERFDVAFGSGTRAQTYAYWQGNRLLQLPLSYFKEIHNWANSPGFPSQAANFNRVIISRCLECHASFAENQFVQTGSLSVTQEYDKNSMIYGINCQRCHGPAAQHVEYQEQHPDNKHAKYMVRYQSLTRAQKVDMCAVCHSGSDKELQKTTFAFKLGDRLNDYYVPFGQTNDIPDVHGNQANLLSSSKCYTNSAVMTCTTCHSSHTKETNKLTAYTQKCITCHKEENHTFCKMAPKLGAAINNKCIDCHMPAMPSKLITYQVTAAKQRSSYYLHTHQIAVYPDKTKEITAFIKRTKS
ncbi:cytochrome c3 family protein [Mucilaginibacter sp. PAMB04168]|uniref:cytochrome c3 family protein n=1 Tax=Mucilaginibacter sp. PAMB04168 TaxID=3138567 RepID=UPI0031F6548E